MSSALCQTYYVAILISSIFGIMKVDSVVAENDELRQAQLEQLSSQADTHLGPMGPMAAALLAESDEKLEVFLCTVC